MLTKALSMAAIAAAVSACTALPPPRMAAVGEPRALPTAPAPITFDGHVAGQATDYVFVLVPDARPATPGLALGAGETLRLVMPAAFKRNGSVMISADTDANLVLTKGWPQGAVRLAGQYRVGYDEQANTLVVTASRAIATDGANAPGIKVIHLRGRTFVNPMPGDYPVSVIHAAADGRPLATWQGALRVLDDAPSAHLAPTHFHVQPGANADHQQVASGQVAPLALGLLLWGEQGAALDGVGIAPRDLARYPKYTGGLLVQDSNRDRKLDPATDKVVGGIIGAAPQGAIGQSATSPLRDDGTPIFSGEVLRHASYPAGGSQPNPGLLAIRFKVGDKAGLYRPTFELIHGNSYQFTIEATGR